MDKEHQSLIPEKVSRLLSYRDRLNYYLEGNETKLQIDLIKHSTLKMVVKEIGELVEEIGREFREENKR